MGIISEYKNCFQFLTFNQTPPKKLLIELSKKPCQQQNWVKMIFTRFITDGTISDAF
jgi:hypothetical protein